MGINWKFWNKRISPIKDVDSPRYIPYYTGDIPVNYDNSLQVSAFYRGLMYISSQIAKLPWEIKDQNNNQINNALSYLLDVEPNNEMSSLYFRMSMIQNAIIYGNAIAEIERDLSGKPIAIWPLGGRDFDIHRDDKGNMYYRILSGSSYSSPDVWLPKEDVFHIKNLHTKDGIIGQGIVAYATDILGISLGADRMAGGLFSNGGMPSGILEVPGSLDEAAVMRIRDSWRAAHSGRKAGGTAVLEEGVKFYGITLTPEVLQFLESRKFNVLEIARFLGVPPTKLFDVDAATYANMENANLEVATDTLHVWAKAFEQEADIKLLRRKYTKRKSSLNLYDVFKGDMSTRAEYFSKMMQMGAITPNEVRLKEGEAPYEGGDRYWIAVNNYSPSDRVDEIIDSNLNKGNDNKPPIEEGASQISQELDREALRFLKGR